MNVRTAAAILATTTILGAAPARAQDPTPADPAAPAPAPASKDAPAGGAPVAPIELRARAEALATSAKQHFDRGEYADAIKDYREAYRLLPSVGLLYNMAQAYRLVGDCPKAAQMYRDFLRLAPDSPVRATAEQNLAAAEMCSTETETSVKPAEPKPEPAVPPPGTPDQVAKPPPPPAPVEQGGGLHGRKLVGVLVAGGGVLFAAAGIYFAADASSAQSQVAKFYADGGKWQDIQAVDSRGHRDRVLAIGSFVTATAAIAAGAALWLTADDDERSVAVMPLPGGAEVTAGWRF